MNILHAVADDLLEALVVPSFTRIGYVARRRLWGWDDPSSWSLAGRTVVVTGPTSGLGREAARSFARMGARLVLVGRDAGRLEETRAELAALAPEASLSTVIADMSSLPSVRAAADAILASEPRIDVVVDNAGAIFAERGETEAGIERTFATMVAGPFVLVARLLPRLQEAPDGRVVAVTSGGMYTQSLPLDDLGYTRGTYQGALAYARAKRAQVALVREWTRRLQASGRAFDHGPDGRTGKAPAINAMHPGWADTPGLEASLPGFRTLMGGLLRSPAEGVDTLLWLAAAPEAAARSGGLYLDRRPRLFDRIPSTRLSATDRRELWDRVVAMTVEMDPAPEASRAG